jgi:hypothetical protein
LILKNYKNPLNYPSTPSFSAEKCKKNSVNFCKEITFFPRKACKKCLKIRLAEKDVKKFAG